MMSLYIIIVLLFLLCNNIDIAKSARLPTCYENVNCSWTYFVHDTGTHPFATGECFKGFCKCRPAEVGQYCQFLKPRGGFSCKTQGNCKVKNGEDVGLFVGGTDPDGKKEGKEGPAKTFKEKMMEKAQKAADLAAKKAAQAAEAAKKKVQNKLAENFDGIKSTADEEAERKKREQELAEEEEDDEDILLARKKKKSKWKKKTDGSGKVFYYNRETKMSVWDRPDDFDGKE